MPVVGQIGIEWLSAFAMGIDGQPLGHLRALPGAAPGWSLGLCGS